MGFFFRNGGSITYYPMLLQFYTEPSLQLIQFKFVGSVVVKLFFWSKWLIFESSIWCGSCPGTASTSQWCCCCCWRRSSDWVSCAPFSRSKVIWFSGISRLYRSTWTRKIKSPSWGRKTRCWIHWGPVIRPDRITGPPSAQFDIRPTSLSGRTRYPAKMTG